MSEKMKCHHKGCGHEWEPRVKRPKKCPVCQNPLWQSPNPKKGKVKVSAPTPIGVSEAPAPTPPTTVTNPEESPVVADGVGEPVEQLEPIYSRVEVTEPEPLTKRLQREAEERLRRLADAD